MANIDHTGYWCPFSALFFGLTGAWEHKEVSLCFVPFRFNAFAGFVSGFHTGWNLGARTGNRFSFSVAQDQMLVAWDQMLVAWGDRAPLEHSLAFLFFRKMLISAFLLKFKAKYLEKMCSYSYFSLWIPITLAKLYFFCMVLTWHKNFCI